MKDRKRGDELEIEMLLEYVDGIIATLREPFLVLDKSLRVITANRAFYTAFDVPEKDTIGRSLPDMGNGQWNIPKLIALLKEILPEHKMVKDYEVEHAFERIGHRAMILNACKLRVPNKVAAMLAGAAKEELILLAIEDITERKRLHEELKESEERFRRVFETSRDALLLIHKTKGDIVNSNPSAEALLGYSSEDFLKKKIWEIGLMKDSGEFQEVFSRLGKDGLIHYKDTPVKTKEGLSIDAEVYLVDKAKVAQCNIRDVTKRKEGDEALKESEARFKAVFDDALDGILVADIETRRFFMFNKAICRMLGYAEEEIKRLSVDDIHPEKDLPYVLEQFERPARGESKLAANLPVKKKDGTIVYADVNTSLVTLGGKKYIMGFFRDITERKKLEMERERLNKKLKRTNISLKQLTFRDSHTGLFNHRYLKHAIEAQFSQAERQFSPLSVIMMDIDYFKSVNDIYGHLFGDLILKQFAGQVKKIVRPCDTIIRYGGEEFIIITGGANRQNAVSMAEKILSKINVHIFGDGKRAIMLKLSLGVASYPEDNVIKGMDMVELADRILDKAKEGGGNRVCSSLELEKAIGIVEGTDDALLLKKKIDKLTTRASQSIVEATFGFAKTIALKDHYTGEHMAKSVHYAARIFEELNLSKDKIEIVKQAAMLHDLGKIGISDKILHKKSKPSEKELAEIRKHPQIGVDIIRPIQSLHPIIPFILYHHERWDGKGYPYGIKKKRIPLGARVIAVADVYQALVSKRPYRKAYSKKEAIKIIKEGSGTQFDPDIVKVFVNILRRER